MLMNVKEDRTMKKTLLMLLFMMVTQGAWAWPGSGTSGSPYLITSVSDWNTLATNVNGGTNYSGMYFRLTADISVTTMIGNSESNSFRGTFDGNGHTLTISYNTTSDYTAPFRYIQGATFKNLKVTGSITTTMNLAAGIAGLNTGSTATFEQCVTDVAINSSSTTVVGWGAFDYHGGFLARSNDANVNLTDCVCGGSVNGSSSTQSKSAGFVGVVENGTVTGTSCLSTTSYTDVNSWNSLCHTAANAHRSASVFYYVNATESHVGTQVTTSQLADGSYATALQAGRSTTVWIQYAAIHQPMLKLFALNQANDGYYLIGSEQEWRNFATLVLTTPTANARMTADISVTTMVGNSDSSPFSGTYDGGGYTISVNLTNNTSEHTAPFRFIRGATIRNLHITGSINTNQMYAAGIVGRAICDNTIINCSSDVFITTTRSGDGTDAGLVGAIWGDGNNTRTTLTGCVFTGKLLGSSTNCCGGLVGWCSTNLNASLTIENCLYAPQERTVSASSSKTFSRGGDFSKITITNSYYTETLGDAQGKQARSITAGDDVTISNLGNGTEYNVSGITAYTHGIKYNGTYYAGNGDAVSLTLSHGDKAGYTFSQYTVTGGGSLANPTADSPTLTMTDADQIIGAEWTVNESLAIPVTMATIMGESKFVTTFYHGTLDYQLPDGALAYTAGKVNGKVVFYRIGTNSNVIPKNTAVIIVADSSADITLTKLPSTDVTPKAGNILRGSDVEITKPSGTVYVLGVVGSVLGFYPFTEGIIPAGKAYYVVN